MNGQHAPGEQGERRGPAYHTKHEAGARAACAARRRGPRPGETSERTRKTRSRRASSFCTSSSFWLRAGPETPSRTTNRWWHCVHSPPAAAAQVAAPAERRAALQAAHGEHLAARASAESDHGHDHERPPGSAVKRFSIAGSHALPPAACAAACPAQVLRPPRPRAAPANFAQSWSWRRGPGPPPRSRPCRTSRAGRSPRSGRWPGGRPASAPPGGLVLEALQVGQGQVVVEGRRTSLREAGLAVPCL